LLWSLGGTSVQGVFGPWLLLTPLALLAVRWKHGRRLLLAAGLFGLPALAAKAFTLVLPFAVFAAPALGMAVQNTPGVLPLVLILHSVVSWHTVVAGYAEHDVWRIKGIRIAKALRSTSEEAQLERLEGYGMAGEIERLVPPNAKILTLAPVPQAYTARRLWDDTESAAGEVAFETMSAGYRARARQLGAIDFHFAPQPLRAVRAVQTVRADTAWSVIEMRVYLGGREVERRSSWRVSALPNAWDAARAFDNSEVTAWSTWQAVEPGMYLEEQFDAPVAVDEVVLIGPYDRWAERLRIDGRGVEARGADGPWRTLASQPVIAVHLSPPGMRRAAVEELRSAGFEYIVAKMDSRLGWDLDHYPSYWGISLLKRVGDFCVFRLE